MNSPNAVPDYTDLVAEDISEWGLKLVGLPDVALRKLAKQLVRYDARFAEAESVVSLLDELIHSPVQKVRMLAAFVLEILVKSAWDEQLSQRIFTLATDSNWGIREGAQLALKAALLTHFEDVIVFVEMWANHPNPSVRRAALLACRPTPRLPLARITRRLDVIERLINDSDSYVMKNVPYALGFFRHYPDLVLPRLRCWAEHPELRTRRNVALSCAGGLAQTHPDQVMAILRPLVTDQRHMVHRAVLQALRAVARKHPNIVRQTMESWAVTDDVRDLLDELWTELQDLW